CSGSIPEDGDASELWDGFLDQLGLLPAVGRGCAAHARDVTAGSSDARNKPERNVICAVHDDDWNGCSRLFGSLDRGRSGGDYDVNPETPAPVVAPPYHRQTAAQERCSCPPRSPARAAPAGRLRAGS